MFNRSIFENSVAAGIPTLEIIDQAVAEEREAPLVVPLKQSELRGEVTGPLAALRLTQKFGYSREEADRVLEALYRFPLPGDAAVTGVLVRFGEVEIRAELKAREQAEGEYEAARQEGKQAALLTRESPDVFTLQIAGIQPDEEITIETRYVQLARPAGSEWRLRIPLTTPPRYVRSDELTSRHARGQPFAVLRDPGHRFSLDLTFRQAEEVVSPTHALELEREGERLQVRLKGGALLPDRDCVLQWRPVQEQERPALHLLLHDDPHSEHLYFLALVAPPATRDPGGAVPRETILLVDHSGSMEGPKWQAADWTVERFLADLSERDGFALGLFHSTTKWFRQKIERARAETVEKAIQFLKGSRDTGGTELGVALEQALALPREARLPARHLLIVTDAQVADAGRILRLADEESTQAERRRISVICIDAAPNDFLVTELAERGGGSAHFLTSNPSEGDITTALDEVLAGWAEPVLAGLRLEVNRPEVESAGRESGEGAEGWSQIDLGDLPAGRSIWVSGRLPREGEPLAFRLVARDGQEVARAEPTAVGDEANRAIKALFGARRVLGLEFLIHATYQGEQLQEQLRRLGYDPAGILTGEGGKVYAENTRRDAESALRDLLQREALAYGLASAESAFVAIRQEAGRPVEGQVYVANALPQGWSHHFIPGYTGSVRAAMHLSAGAVMPSMQPPSPSAPLRASGPGLTWTASASGESPLQKLKGKLARFSKRAPSPEEAAEPESASPESRPLFTGVPELAGGQAILFDSTQAVGALPDQITLRTLRLHFDGERPAPEEIDPSLVLLLYIGDLSLPRAQVRVADLVRMRGERPLHLLKQPSDVVRLVLSDPNGRWAQDAPRIEVTLLW